MFSLLQWLQLHPVLEEIDVLDAPGHDLWLVEERRQTDALLGQLQPDHLPRHLLIPQIDRRLTHTILPM
jgi:hypothetical protein